MFSSSKTFFFVVVFLSKVKNGKLYMATFAAVLGPLSFGFVLGYSSPAIPDLQRIPDPRLRLTVEEASWFGVKNKTVAKTMRLRRSVISIVDQVLT